MQEHSEPEWLTPTKVAHLLDVAATTVVAWANKGVLKAYRDSSGRRLFKAEEVMNLRRCRRASNRKL